MLGYQVLASEWNVRAVAMALAAAAGGLRYVAMDVLGSFGCRRQSFYLWKEYGDSEIGYLGTRCILVLLMPCAFSIERP